MAKTQNLSLSPTKISGTCGRLMCCLKYEQDAYEDLIRNSPKQESFVDTPDGRGTVVELDLLRQRVKVRMEDRPESIQTFQNSEIAILRNGKAKKTDPPIPADLAPISGGGKRKKRFLSEDETVALDSIRMRYSTETIAEEKPVTETESPEKETSQSKNRRNRRKNKPANPEQPRQEQPKKEQPKKEQPKKDAPKKEQPKKDAQKNNPPASQEDKGDAPKRSGHRPRYRRRRSGNSGEKNQ